MRFEGKAEQHTFTHLCVELGKSPMETKQLLENTQSGSSVSRALVYRRHIRVSDDFLAPLSSKLTVKHTIFTESLTSNVLNALQHYACKTVRGSAL